MKNPGTLTMHFLNRLGSMRETNKELIDKIKKQAYDNTHSIHIN